MLETGLTPTICECEFLFCTLFHLLLYSHSEIAKHLALPPVKLHCSMLAEDAIKAAVRDYQAKRAAAMAAQGAQAESAAVAA